MPCPCVTSPIPQHFEKFGCVFSLSAYVHGCIDTRACYNVRFVCMHTPACFDFFFVCKHTPACFNVRFVCMHTSICFTVRFVRVRTRACANVCFVPCAAGMNGVSTLECKSSVLSSRRRTKSLEKLLTQFVSSDQMKYEKVIVKQPPHVTASLLILFLAQ